MKKFIVRWATMTWLLLLSVTAAVATEPVRFSIACDSRAKPGFVDVMKQLKAAGGPARLSSLPATWTLSKPLTSSSKASSASRLRGIPSWATTNSGTRRPWPTCASILTSSSRTRSWPVPTAHARRLIRSVSARSTSRSSMNTGMANPMSTASPDAKISPGPVGLAPKRPQGQQEAVEARGRT